MSMQISEQAVHNRINLSRLVKRLETTVSDDDWSQESRNDTWIKAQGTLQKIKHARRLLKNVEADDMDISSKAAQRYRDIRVSLDRAEDFILVVVKRVAPVQNRPESILSKIPTPQPIVPPRDHNSHARSPSLLPDNLSSETPMISLPTDDLLLSPAESSALPSSFGESSSMANNPTLDTIVSPRISPSYSPSLPTKSTTTATPGFIQNSNALQQELSDQLAQMATQLKRNALHFSESLAKDQAVVEDAQVKLEGNYDVMKKERLRVRDLRGKTGGTTCLVIMSVVAVLVAFLFMVLLIRAT